MNEKKQRPVALRALNSLCVITLIVSITWIIVEGFRLTSSMILGAAILALASPVVISGDGVADILSGLVEALMDGITAIFDAIVEVVSGLF